MAITKVSLTYSDGSVHDFLSIDDAAAMAATPELHPDAPALPADAGVAAPVTPEPDHATPAEEGTPTSGQAQAPTETEVGDAA